MVRFMERLPCLVQAHLDSAPEEGNAAVDHGQLKRDARSGFQNGFRKQITAVWPYFTDTAAELEERLQECE